MAVLAARAPFSEPSTATNILFMASDLLPSAIGEGSGVVACRVVSFDITTILVLLMTKAKRIPTPESTAAPRKAYRNPSTVAAAAVTDAPRLAATTPTMVTAMANPNRQPARGGGVG